jgi:NAD(P)-dependent dehydrogenase (short-subunit alcohol dehydrogenase family)
LQDLTNLKNYSPSIDLLKNRKILVTGAGDGIGKVAAITYAKYGATVILLGRNKNKLNNVYDEIVSAGYDTPIIVELDLLSSGISEYKNLNEQIIDSFGSLDGLLHNASILGEMKPLKEYDIKIFDEVITTNLRSNFLLTKAVLPAMEQSNDASIIFTSSGVGRKGRAYWGAYAISKFATEGLMETWADELENIGSIRVNSINPGATSTKMRKQAYPLEPKGKNPKPIKIMPAYLFLIGPDSIGINGCKLDAQ